MTCTSIRCRNNRRLNPQSYPLKNPEKPSNCVGPLLSERQSRAAPLSASSLEIALPLGRVTLKGGIDGEVLRLVVALLSHP